MIKDLTFFLNELPRCKQQWITSNRRVNPSVIKNASQRAGN